MFGNPTNDGLLSNSGTKVGPVRKEDATSIAIPFVISGRFAARSYCGYDICR